MTSTNHTPDAADNRQRNPHWHKVADADELVEGEVRVCPVGLKTVAVTRLHGRYGAIDNRCPHQGGPLGQGTVENDKIRCPWHGFDFDPFTGQAAGDPISTSPLTRYRSVTTASTSPQHRRAPTPAQSVMSSSRR